MSKTVTDEKTYITESLDFINTNKTNFSPLLTSIAKKMNGDKDLIAAMTTAQNSNLKELIVKLMGKDSTKGDFTKYVEQCLRIMGIKDSKNNIYELLNLVIQELKANADLMEKVIKFKKDNTEWNKMVDMLRDKNDSHVPNAEGEGVAGEGEKPQGRPPGGTREETSLDDVKLEVKGGGQQRLTRKQKNSIGTARKTRTNR